MSDWKRELQFRAVGLLGGRLLGGLFATARTTRGGLDPVNELHAAGTRVVYAFWHDQMLPLVHFHRHEGAVVLVSEHADGEYIARLLLPEYEDADDAGNIARVLESRGFETARGSSTRGGMKGLRRLVRAAREGRDVAVTPDGPRGPRHHFKEGTLVAAQMTGNPVIPIGVSAHPAWRLDSWDRFLIPRPLSRVHAEYGPPVSVPRDADRTDRRRLAAELEETLEELTRVAEARVGREEPRATSA